MMLNTNREISLSVIVCCYNMENYLDLSLHSLEMQWGDRTDYEIILVNDGSTDGTILKLNDFKARYPEHVKVIDKRKNEGVSAARNSALDIASGAWIAFFDPDDMLAEGGYSKLLELIDNNSGFDFLRYGMKVVDVGQDIPSPVITERLTVDWEGTSVEDMLENSFGICTCYLIKRELLEGRRFPDYIIVEDLLYIVPILLEGKRVIKTNAKIYYYVIRTDSATYVTHDYNRLRRQSDDISHAVELLEEFKQGQPEEVQSRLLGKQQLLVHNMSVRMLLSNMGTHDVKRIVQLMKKLNFYPLPADGMMVRLMNYVFSHLWALPVFRPMYRLFRSVYPMIRRFVR